LRIIFKGCIQSIKYTHHTNHLLFSNVNIPIVNCIVVGIHLSHCLAINISGDTNIETGVPYKVTCTVSEFKENRRTAYSAIIIDEDITELVIYHLASGECVYRTNNGTPTCPSSVCSCDTDGLATHWIYTTPTNFASSVTFRCNSKSNGGSLTYSEPFEPTIVSKCIVFMVNNPAILKEDKFVFKELCVSR
jgi:hypothetical protein